MKTYVTLIACLLFAANTFAQFSEIHVQNSDTVAVSISISTSTKSDKEKKEQVQSSVSYNGSPYNFAFSWKRKKFDPHWTGMGIAVAGLDGVNKYPGDLVGTTSYSIVFNPIDYTVPLNRHFMLVSGLGIDWSRYHFEGNVGLEKVDGTTQFISAPEGTTYQSSKLLIYYFTFPLMLEYQPIPWKNKGFFLSGGMVAYIRCYSKSQVEKNIVGGTQQIDLGRDLNLLPVNARFMVQAGMGDVSVYAYYSALSMFKNGKGPDVKPMGIGIVLDF